MKKLIPKYVKNKIKLLIKYLKNYRSENILEEIYDEEYFKENIADSLPMAKYMSSKIKEYLNLNSVFDIGCATGHWLSCYQELGCDISGLEGTSNAFPYLMVDKEKIDVHDLRNPYNKTKNVDLVSCIEVAEHIEPKFADVLVDTITMHQAPHILFTAAPPGQGGQGHFNLKYKPYWIKKFKKRGYTVDEDFQKKIINWSKEARENFSPASEFRLLSVKDGTPIKALNWESHDDAMEGDLTKLKTQIWEYVWIPFWFPHNVITFKKMS